MMSSIDSVIYKSYKKGFVLEEWMHFGKNLRASVILLPKVLLGIHPSINLLEMIQRQKTKRRYETQCGTYSQVHIVG